VVSFLAVSRAVAAVSLRVVSSVKAGSGIFQAVCLAVHIEAEVIPFKTKRFPFEMKGLLFTGFLLPFEKNCLKRGEFRVLLSRQEGRFSVQYEPGAGSREPGAGSRERGLSCSLPMLQAWLYCSIFGKFVQVPVVPCLKTVKKP
jgi:hypothetical protein